MEKNTRNTQDNQDNGGETSPVVFYAFICLMGIVILGIIINTML